MGNKQQNKSIRKKKKKCTEPTTDRGRGVGSRDIRVQEKRKKKGVKIRRRRKIPTLVPLG